MNGQERQASWQLKRRTWRVGAERGWRDQPANGKGALDRRWLKKDGKNGLARQYDLGKTGANVFRGLMSKIAECVVSEPSRREYGHHEAIASGGTMLMTAATRGETSSSGLLNQQSLICCVSSFAKPVCERYNPQFSASARQRDFDCFNQYLFEDPPTFG
jgi:hypothetical protein